ncbi:MAG TPA: hypothetical protein VM165_14210 [Planctomycetaceae bacterium]|nr:hypothetical protein [Planctomycetaceae bacterium]
MSTESFDCQGVLCECAADPPPHRWSDEVTDAEIAEAKSIGLMSATCCEQDSCIVLAGTPQDVTLWIRMRDDEAVDLCPLLGRIYSAHPGCLLQGMCAEGGEVRP